MQPDPRPPIHYGGVEEDPVGVLLPPGRYSDRGGGKAPHHGTGRARTGGHDIDRLAPSLRKEKREQPDQQDRPSHMHVAQQRREHGEADEDAEYRIRSRPGRESGYRS
jgi:hypothetical protein